MQAPVNLTPLLSLMGGIEVKDLAVYRQSNGKCLNHRDFCEKFGFGFFWI